MPLHLLDIVKKMSIQSGGNVTEMTKSARLVNKHWHKWGNGATQTLRLSRVEGYSQDRILEIVTNTFTNLEVLQLHNSIRVSNQSMGSLKSLKRLRHIDLLGFNITRTGLTWLKGLTTLRHLCLSCFGKVTNKGLDILRNLVTLESLELFDIFTDTQDEEIQFLAELPSLTKLYLTWFDDITDKGIRCLSNLKGLSLLHLTHCTRVQGTGLASLTGLTDLSLNGCWSFGDEGLQCLTNLANLTSLTMKQCPGITEKSLRSLTALSNLVKLDLQH